MVQQTSTADPISHVSQLSSLSMAGDAASTGLPQIRSRTKRGLLRDWWLELMAVLLSA